MSLSHAISRVHVRYAETDQMGLVYYANYFVWFEVGRTDLLRGAGWTYRAMETEGYFLPVIEAVCHYHKPAKYDDDVEVRTRGWLLSPIRVKFEYEVVRPADAALLASGHTVHASLSRAGRPRRLPDRVRTLFASPGRARGKGGRVSASASGVRGSSRPAVPDTRERNGARASANGVRGPSRPVVPDTRERNGASASASGGGAPRESKR